MSEGEVVMAVCPRLMAIVSGFPRSGTSMMMRALSMNGAPIAGVQFPDGLSTEANPHGFYEHGPLTHLGKCPAWLADDAEGKVVKIFPFGLHNFSAGLWDREMPPVVFMLRDPGSIMASVEAWRGRPAPVADLLRRMTRFQDWLGHGPQKAIDRFLFVDYDAVIENPAHTLHNVLQHIGHPVASVDISCIDQSLRRSHRHVWPEDQQNDGATVDRLYSQWLGGRGDRTSGRSGVNQ